jgi:hypothetical protein
MDSRLLVVATLVLLSCPATSFRVDAYGETARKLRSSTSHRSCEADKSASYDPALWIDAPAAGSILLYGRWVGINIASSGLLGPLNGRGPHADLSRWRVSFGLEGGGIAEAHGATVLAEAGQSHGPRIYVSPRDYTRAGSAPCDRLSRRGNCGAGVRDEREATVRDQQPPPSVNSPYTELGCTCTSGVGRRGRRRGHNQCGMDGVPLRGRTWCYIDKELLSSPAECALLTFDFCGDDNTDVDRSSDGTVSFIDITSSDHVVTHIGASCACEVVWSGGVT